MMEVEVMKKAPVAVVCGCCFVDMNILSGFAH